MESQVVVKAAQVFPGLSYHGQIGNVEKRKDTLQCMWGTKVSPKQRVNTSHSLHPMWDPFPLCCS